MITVYTLPNCSACDQTKKAMDKLSLQYTTVDLSTDPEAVNKVLGMGYKAAPVVIAGEDHWSGFRLDRINALVAQGIEQ